MKLKIWVACDPKLGVTLAPQKLITWGDFGPKYCTGILNRDKMLKKNLKPCDVNVVKFTYFNLRKFKCSQAFQAKAIQFCF